RMGQNVRSYGAQVSCFGTKESINISAFYRFKLRRVAGRKSCRHFRDAALQAAERHPLVNPAMPA
ncbi:MAG: hypothetical protein WCC96_01965, partial [Rhodomicrobium sp.]